MSRKNFMAQAAVALTVIGFMPMPAAAAAQSRARADAAAVPNAELLPAAQAAVAAANLTCDVTGARTPGKTEDGVDIYEVSCASGPGYILTTATPPMAFNCILLSSRAEQTRAEDPDANVGNLCELPANNNALQVLAAYAATAGVSCQVDQGAWIGRTTTGEERYEVGCANADGYWLEVRPDATISVKLECAEVIRAGQTCRYSTTQERAAGLTARLAGTNAPACTIQDVRFAGANQNGRFYEAKCAEGSGFIARFNPDGAYNQVYACANAQHIGGGCTLTDASGAIAQQAEGRVGQLAQLGKPCTVTQERLIGVESAGQGREVREYACSDQPLGVIGYFAPAGGEGSMAIDCFSAEARAITCQYTSMETIKTALTAMLAADGKTCEVTAFQVLSRMIDNDGDVAEVKCADGSGYLGEFPDARQRTGQVQTCIEARRVGDSCTL